MTWNLGSVAETVLALVPDVPTSISGTQLLNIADRSRQYVQNYTGVTIGSNSIGLDYQNAILYLSIANTTELMNLTGADAQSVTLGELTINKGTTNNLTQMGLTAKQMAMEELKTLGGKSTYYKSNG